MSSKTSILAIAVAAIMIVCSLSGAVMIANSNSNNNGDANDFEKNVDTTVILPVEESSDSISMQEYSALMAEAEKAKKDAAKAAADLEAQKIAAAEAEAAVIKAEEKLAKASADLEAQKIAAAEAGATVTKTEAELAKVLEAQKTAVAEAEAAVIKAEAELAKALEAQKTAAAEADEAVIKAEAELAKTTADLEAQKIAAAEASATVTKTEAELAKALEDIKNLEAAAKVAAEALKAAEVAAAEAKAELEASKAVFEAAQQEAQTTTAAVIESKVFVPSTMVELSAVLANPEFADMALYDVLEGKYFETADGEVLIDSVQDAASYLYRLGYFVVVDNLFVSQENFVSGFTKAEPESVSEEKDVNEDIDYLALIEQNEKKIIELKSMKAAEPVNEVEFQEQIDKLTAENEKLKKEYEAIVKEKQTDDAEYEAAIKKLKDQIDALEEKAKNEELTEVEQNELGGMIVALEDLLKAKGSSDPVDEDKVDETEAAIKGKMAQIDEYRALMKQYPENIAEYEEKIKTLQAEISELQNTTSSEKTEVVLEKATFAVPTFRSIQTLTAAEFLDSQWAVNPSTQLEMLMEEMTGDDVPANINELQLEQMRVSTMLSARIQMMAFLSSFDKEVLVESTLVELLDGTPFIMNGELKTVKDNETLMMYFNSTFGFDFAGTAFVLYNPNYNEGGIIFVDVDDMIPLGILQCQFLTADDGIHFTGKDYARIAVSQYLVSGLTQRTVFLESMGIIIDEQPDLTDCVDDCGQFPSVLEVFMGTTFYFNGENVVVKDVASFEKYLSSIGVAAGNGLIFVTTDNHLEAYDIESINFAKMIDILRESNFRTYFEVQMTEKIQISSATITMDKLSDDLKLDLMLKLESAADENYEVSGE